MNSSFMHERHFRRVLMPHFLVQKPSDVQTCSEDHPLLAKVSIWEMTMWFLQEPLVKEAKERCETCNTNKTLGDSRSDT